MEDEQLLLICNRGRKEGTVSVMTRCWCEGMSWHVVCCNVTRVCCSVTRECCTRCNDQVLDLRRCHWHKMCLHPNVCISKCVYVQMCVHPNVCTSECVYIQMCLHPNISKSKYVFIQMFLYPNVFTSKCVSIQMFQHPNVSPSSHLLLDSRTCHWHGVCRDDR